MPQVSAASVLVFPSRTRAKAKSRRATEPSRSRAAADRKSQAVWSFRVSDTAIIPSNIWRESNHESTTRGNPQTSPRVTVSGPWYYKAAPDNFVLAYGATATNNGAGGGGSSITEGGTNFSHNYA
jgi:hypothetical protein